jgi:hypothetical protein
VALDYGGVGRFASLLPDMADCLCVQCPIMNPPAWHRRLCLLEQDDPGVAIRRLHDRCFHRVEEVVPEGYIVQGVLVAHDEVAQACLIEPGGDLPACDLPGKDVSFNPEV